MKAVEKQYTDEMKENFGYYAAWNPGVPLQLGDIGTLDGNVFTRIGSLSDQNISFEKRPDPTKINLEYNSHGNVTLTTKLEGAIAPVGSILKDTDAGIVVEFGKENSTLFKANNTTSPSIKDQIKLGDEVLKLYRDGKWDKHWMVITELVEAESATIIISNNSNAKIELKANANISASAIDIADAKFGFSTQISHGLETSIISKEGLTPLFKVMGIRLRFLAAPIFKAASINEFDLLTPETAETEYKEKICFVDILDDEKQ